MLTPILDIIKEFNDNYSQTALVFLAVISLSFAYNEIILKKRPYVVPEIFVDEKENGDWFFHVVLVNKGEKPGIAHISRAVLKIGDETYPTEFNLNIVLAPNEKNKLLPIGHINLSGRSKIMSNGYSSNTVEIILETQSKAVGDKEFRYTTKEKYIVDVTQGKPVTILLEESLD